MNKKGKKDTENTILFAHLNNLINFSNTLETEGTTLIEENSNLSKLYSIWLKDLDTIISNCLSENQNRFTLNKFNPKLSSNINNNTNIFPEIKKLKEDSKDKYIKVLSEILELNSKRQIKRRYSFSFEANFTLNAKGKIKNDEQDQKIEKPPINTINTISPIINNMDTIIEQSSREEKDIEMIISSQDTHNLTNANVPIKINKKDKIITTTFSNLANCTFVNEDNNISVANKDSIIDVSIKCGEFTFSKPNEKKNDGNLVSKVSKMEIIQQKEQSVEKKKNLTEISESMKKSPPMIPQWTNPYNSKGNNLPQHSLFEKEKEKKNNCCDVGNKKKESKRNWEYVMTDQSESSDDEEYEEEESESESGRKEIAQWVMNKKQICEIIARQNKLKVYYGRFGKFKCEQLNLNMLFETINKKYMIRNSTADWRLDNTLQSMSNQYSNNKVVTSGTQQGSNVPTRHLYFTSSE